RGWGDRGEELALAQQVLVDQPPPDLLRQIRQCQRRQARPGDRGGAEAARLRLVDEEAALPVPESLDQRRRRRGAAAGAAGGRRGLGGKRAERFWPPFAKRPGPPRSRTRRASQPSRRLRSTSS